ncbi:transposase [Streptomyces sp. Rer75]|uniref:transposase n=1 Tax=unclassified Streptomyces TaxID=2593676 RepID=UPI00211DF092|nr:transposase [Streptomyces sp. Rer75]
MGSKQRTCTPEFREGAVRIVIEAGRPIPEVAEELGVHSGTLHSWVSALAERAERKWESPSTRQCSGSMWEGCPRRKVPLRAAQEARSTSWA